MQDYFIIEYYRISMKQMHLLLSIGIVIIVGITICFLQMNQKKERFVNEESNTESTEENKDVKSKLPLKQNSKGVSGDEQVLIFWRSNENKDHPIKYFIVQYYDVTGDSRVIHSKLVPKKYKVKEHSTLIKGLKNHVQYLFQVVGVNNQGLGDVEEGNILIAEPGTTLFK